MNYILGFDIGNTSTTMGIYADNEIFPRKTYYYPTKKNISIRELKNIIKKYADDYSGESGNDVHIAGLAFSSVAPEINQAYHKTAQQLYKCDALEINAHSKLSIKINYDNPAELGPDRIVNAEAAFREYARDCIIIDMGTANTFCVLLADGTFDGGIIGPGIGITIDALAKKTSMLMKINFEKPAAFIAKNTQDAIKSGFYYGWSLMIEGIISKIEEEYGRNFLTVFTGGFSSKIADSISKNKLIDPILTMKGIKYIYNFNKMS